MGNNNDKNKADIFKNTTNSALLRKKINLRDDPYIARKLDETACMRAYINYESARKEVDRIDSEKNLDEHLNEMAYRLDSRLISSHELFSQLVDINLEDAPEELKEVVMHIAHRTGWGYLPVLLLILFSTASATRGKYIGKIDGEWSEAIVLYVLICAESGNMKSSMLKMVMRPHYLFENKKQNEYTDGLLSSDRKADLQQARKIALKQSERMHRVDLQINKDSLQEFAENIRYDREIIEECYRVDETSAPPLLFTEDTSFPKLYESMQRNGGGSTFASAEGNTLLHLVFASRSPLDIFTKAYDYEKFITATKRDGTKLFQNPFLNIGLVVNPDITRQLYSNNRLGLHGLTPRFAICFGGKQHDIIEDAPSKDGYNDYLKRINDLLEDCYTQEPTRKLVEIQFSSEAKRELYAIQDSFEKEQKRVPKGQTHYHAHIRKLHGLIARIATILHIWQHQEPDKELVSKHDVLLAEYIVLQVKKHAEYAFSPDGLCAYYDAQKITDWIKRHRYPSFTSTDVAKGVENMRNENIFPALDALEALNIICQHISPGKPRICVVHRNFL